jgi:trimeric autotransporter adhesin
MATVNKNFRIKHGLIVEGTTGTINGQNILTETGGDQYILNLIGGETLVKSVESTQLQVDINGKLSVKSNVFDAYGAASTAQSNAENYADSLASNYDAAGAASTAQTNAENYADSLASNYDAAGAASTAQTNAENYADGLASNYDAAGAASTAQTNAENYADSLASNYDAAGAAATAQTNAENYADGLASNYDAAGAASTAQTNAENYADGVASTAETNAKNYADGLASNYDAAGSASTAETNAKNYTDDLIGDGTINGTSGNTVSARIASAVSDLVGTAPAVLDTLQELAAAIGNDVNLVDGIGVAIGNKLPLAGGTMSGNIAMGTNKITGLGTPSSNNDAATKKYADDAQTAAESYADGLASNYDAAGAASTAQTNAENYADGVASTAQTNAENYADGLASNYDAAGAASTAQTNAENYADGIVGDVLDGTTPFTAVDVNSVAGIYAATSTVATASTITAWSFNSSTFTSAKLLVKLKTATHSQVSDVLLTLDAAGNVAITEYGIVGTNGSLGDITAINTAGTINIRVTTDYANTDVTVYATALI